MERARPNPTLRKHLGPLCLDTAKKKIAEGGLEIPEETTSEIRIFNLICSARDRNAPRH